MNEDNLIKFSIEYKTYPNSGKSTNDPFTVGLGRINIWLNKEQVWDEEDYIASFALRFLSAIESLKEGEEIYVDHHDSSGFIKLLKTNDSLIFSLGRGEHRLTKNFKIYKEAKINWKDFLKETISATEKFIEWAKSNWSSSLESEGYKALQDKLSEVKRALNL